MVELEKAWSRYRGKCRANNEGLGLYSKTDFEAGWQAAIEIVTDLAEKRAAGMGWWIRVELEREADD